MLLCGTARLSLHLLFLGGGKEADHFHRLLQPFKIVTQIFLIFNLKILLRGEERGSYRECLEMEIKR